MSKVQDDSAYLCKEAPNQKSSESGPPLKMSKTRGLLSELFWEGTIWAWIIVETIIGDDWIIHELWVIWCGGDGDKVDWLDDDGVHVISSSDKHTAAYSHVPYDLWISRLILAWLVLAAEFRTISWEFVCARKY